MHRPISVCWPRVTMKAVVLSRRGYVYASAKDTSLDLRVNKEVGIVLYSLVFSCLALHCIALYCIVLHCIVLHCIVLHCIALHCNLLYCTALHCIVLFCSIHRISYRIVFKLLFSLCDFFTLPDHFCFISWNSGGAVLPQWFISGFRTAGR